MLFLLSFCILVLTFLSSFAIDNLFKVAACSRCYFGVVLPPIICIIGVLKFLFICMSCGLFAVLVLISHFSSPPLASFTYFFVRLKPFIYALCARPSTSRPPVSLSLLCPSCAFCMYNMVEFMSAPTCCVALSLIPATQHTLRSQ